MKFTALNLTLAILAPETRTAEGDRSRLFARVSTSGKIDDAGEVQSLGKRTVWHSSAEGQLPQPRWTGRHKVHRARFALRL